jgi:hypothetical protein
MSYLSAGESTHEHLELRGHWWRRAQQSRQLLIWQLLLWLHLLGEGDSVVVAVHRSWLVS